MNYVRFMFLSMAWVAAFGQPRPAYEAAEIKMNASGDDGSSSDGTKSQVLMKNMSLRRLIERAYNLPSPQVIGPDWLGNVHFDLAAKFPPGTRDTDRNLMLKTLLEDRLKLAVHSESREMPGYVLNVAKGGFKLKPAEPGGTSMSSHGGAVRTLTVTKITMAQLSGYLARTLGQTVVDETRIAGVYDFELKWTQEDLIADAPKNGDAEAPSLFLVLQDQLGLKLQPRKVPAEVIVVDHVERVPLEN